jgi:predicted HTH transcriptional regulator
VKLNVETMLLSDLKRIVKQGEGLQVEFKHKVSEPLKVVREVVAFANTVGGKLFIGINDDRTIAGLKYAEEEEFELKKAIDAHCYPPVSYTVQHIPINSKRTVLLFEIAEHTQKPVFLYYNIKKKRGQAYFRVADYCVRVSKELRKILIGRTKQTHFSGFVYGENERILVRYLNENKQIDKQTLMEIAGISSEIASDILVKMTVANVLEIYPDELKDNYSLKAID